VRMNRTARTCVPIVLALALATGARAGTAADSARGEPGDLPPAGVRAWQTGALAPDKLQHFSLAFSLGLAFGIMTGEPAAASGAAALAVAKEVADARTGSFGKGDLLAGLLGAGCAFFLVQTLER